MDLSALAPLRDLDARRPGFLARIIGIFLEEAPERIEEIRAAAETGDRVRLHRAAHTLKSSAATLGASGLSALCRSLQEATRAEDAAVPTGCAEPIASEFARAAEALSGILAEAQSPHGSR